MIHESQHIARVEHLGDSYGKPLGTRTSVVFVRILPYAINCIGLRCYQVQTEEFNRIIRDCKAPYISGREVTCQLSTMQDARKREAGSWLSTMPGLSLMRGAPFRHHRFTAGWEDRNLIFIPWTDFVSNCIFICLLCFNECTYLYLFVINFSM